MFILFRSLPLPVETKITSSRLSKKDLALGTCSSGVPGFLDVANVKAKISKPSLAKSGIAV